VSQEDAAWLHTQLAKAKHGVPVSHVQLAAKKAGISTRRLQRAAQQVDPIRQRHGFGAKAYWTWRLRTEPVDGTCPCCGLPRGLRPMEVAGFGGTVYVRT
jgi:hypothetical protein